eukprot:CAMPEP_0182911306 /NCGR_PEP_ID=MMETSP0034_2-20130328/36836_1 /TAXON_ID=156128 /ORGANISM="Nephroselmis pyriformis, Strain CCMP717" /LENGTH=51 /DNA_ID=CAMNT_0025047801 /DNA_START=515 /DNA_END=670 /DNA_ORIENTATION=-
MASHAEAPPERTEWLPHHNGSAAVNPASARAVRYHPVMTVLVTLPSPGSAK